MEPSGGRATDVHGSSAQVNAVKALNKPATK
jgi:hypothetical protein